MKKITKRIDEAELQKQGYRGLLGQLLDELLTGEKYEITLVFPQSTMEDLRKHGGPQEWICLEYNVPCLLDSVLALIELGHMVKVEMLRQ